MLKWKLPGTKRIVLIVLSVLALSAAYSMYVRGYFDWWLGEFASGAGAFNPAMCGRAGIIIESVECSSGVAYVSFSNSGRMPLNGNFIAALSTVSTQTFIANDTDSVIRSGQSGGLYFAAEGLAKPISKVTVTFQPCRSVFAEKEGPFTGC